MKSQNLNTKVSIAIMMMGKEKMGEKIIKIPNYTLLQVVLQKVPFFVLFKSAGPSPEQTHALKISQNVHPFLQY